MGEWAVLTMQEMLLARIYVYLGAVCLPDETEVSDAQNVRGGHLPLSRALLLGPPLLCKHLELKWKWQRD